MILLWVLGSSVVRETLQIESLIAIKISLWEPVVFAAVFASTLSSALAALVGAARIFAAVAKGFSLYFRICITQ
jgi:hypothetical protein